VILVSALVTLAGSAPSEIKSDFMPVSIVSDADVSRVTPGQQNAPKLKIDTPKPLADEVNAPKPVQQLAPKVANKPEITTEAAKPPPAPAAKAEKAEKPKPPKPPEPGPKVADKPDKPKPPEYKPDKIADLLKKDEAKKPPKPDDQPAPETPAHDTPKFDANQVAALLDKREPQRQVASAAAINDTADLGSAAGHSAELSQSEIDALRTRISQCWSPPQGIDSNSTIYVTFRVLFKPDGSLARDPVPVEGSASPLGPALAESGKRALRLCQPFTMLRREHYEQWKDIEIKFNPHELLGG